jgi:hypothetical protein
MSTVTKNVFISHHHKDDASVDDLTSLASNKGYILRNSSIRVKPENQARIDQKKVSDRTIERLIRMKMRWAGQLIVIIGKETSTRPWVNWEIQVAHDMGKPIIGVYENGLKDKVEMPPNLQKYASLLVAWRTEAIINALNGEGTFENPDGSPCDKINGSYITC